MATSSNSVDKVGGIQISCTWFISRVFFFFNISTWQITPNTRSLGCSLLLHHQYQYLIQLYKQLLRDRKMELHLQCPATTAITQRSHWSSCKCDLF